VPAHFQGVPVGGGPERVLQFGLPTPDNLRGGADTNSMELTVDGISSVRLDSAYLSSIQSTTGTQYSRRPAGFDAAANLLGMSESDLRTALQSGQSLSDIASSKGISKDQLVSTIATAIQQNNPSMSSDRATTIATDIATRVPGQGGPAGPRGAGGPPPGPPPAQGVGGAGGTDATGETDTESSSDGTSSTTSVSGHHHHHRHHMMATAMNAASQALGMSSSDLTSALQSGQSLSQLASSKGISQDDLVKAISDALAQGNSNLSSDQATQIATGLVTATSQSAPWSTQQTGTASTFGVSA